MAMTNRSITLITIIVAFTFSNGCELGLFSATRSAIDSACDNEEARSLFCPFDGTDCNVAEAAIEQITSVKNFGLPRNGALELLCNVYRENDYDCACEALVVDFVYEDEPEDPDFDICYVNVDRDIEDFDDYETDLSAIRVSLVDGDCEDEFRRIETGLCGDGSIRFIGDFRIGFQIRYFDAETGAFVALEGATDVYAGCNGTNYWPIRIDCADRIVTEVICDRAEF